MKHILVVCSQNKWRSPTAENIYRGDLRAIIHSVGLGANSPHQISQKDLIWADLLLYMEKDHLGRIKKLFPNQTLPNSLNLDIPDDYRYMDPELVQILTDKIEPIITEPFKDCREGTITTNVRVR